MIHRTGLILCSIILVCISCGDPVEPDKNFTILAGRVLDAADSTGIAQANVIVYNANTNAPVTRTFTNTQGYYKVDIDTGTYYLKVSAQTYNPSPPAGMDALPFEMLVGDTTVQYIYLDSSTQVATGGSISGIVTTPASTGIGGVLIVASNTAGTQSFSGTSGPNGFFILYNIEPGRYTLNGYLAEYTQDTFVVSLTVTANVTSENNVIILKPFTTVTLTGHLTFLASQNSQVDITLIHPTTREAIPGLSTVNEMSGNTYQLTAIPVGSYIVWASYRNDGYVMDPDWIAKSGLPRITVTNTTTSLVQDFSVTDAVIIVSPTNPPDTVQPVYIMTSQPTFTWEAYPSAKEYIIEVSNSNGTIIWGGADSSGVVQHTQIPSSSTSTAFNFDNSASDSLRTGGIYRWKIYADNDAQQNIQQLISSSEGLLGLFKVVADTAVF
jgi:hypothetical protein